VETGAGATGAAAGRGGCCGAAFFTPAGGTIGVPHRLQNIESTATRFPHRVQKTVSPDGGTGWEEGGATRTGGTAEPGAESRAGGTGVLTTSYRGWAAGAGDGRLTGADDRER